MMVRRRRRVLAPAAVTARAVLLHRVQVRVVRRSGHRTASVAITSTRDSSSRRRRRRQRLFPVLAARALVVLVGRTAGGGAEAARRPVLAGAANRGVAAGAAGFTMARTGTVAVGGQQQVAPGFGLFKLWGREGGR